MKKRICRYLLLLCMLLAVFTAGALAAGTTTHKHCNYGEQSCSHSQITWSAWSKTTSLPTSGTYYLTKDVTLSSQWHISGTVKLCLNGHTVTVKAGTDQAVYIQESGSLYLTDCQGTGLITPASGVSVTGVVDTGSFYMYGGTIKNFCKNANGSEDDGAAVDVDWGGKFYMMGGTIDNSGISSSGVGVYCYDAVMQLSGNAVIQNCGMTGISVMGTTTLTMNGGAVRNCWSKYGIGIEVGNNGTADISGGAVSGAYYGLNSEGGTVRLSGNPTFENSNSGTDLFLEYASQIQVKGALGGSGTMKVGVAKPDRTVIVGAGSYSLTASDLRHFTSADAALEIRSKTGASSVLEGYLGYPEHKHCVCGGDTTAGDHTSHTSVTWTPWSNTSALPTAAGAYYLVNDVTLSGSWNVSSDIQLCLNGHSVIEYSNTTRIIYIKSGGTLELTDCGKTPGKITVGNGITAGGIDNSGTFSLYGGSIEGCKLDSNGIFRYGGGIEVGGQQAVFNLYGGAIRNCANYVGYSSGGQGGGVYVSSGTFNLYGGTIENCTTRNDSVQGSTGGYGGGVCINDNGVFHMEGGTIQGCYAYEGGGICVYGTANLKDGTIRNNTAEYGGGVGVFGQLNMSGGTITDCKATRRADGINMEHGDFQMTGGTVTKCIGDKLALYVDFDASYTKTGGILDGEIVDRTLVTLTFVTDGGSEVPSIEQKTGTKITPPDAPTRTGYTFAGWDPALPSVMPAAGITVRAQWTANAYHIALDANGGSGTAVSVPAAYDQTQTLPDNPFARAGYAFDGWNTEADGTGTAYADQAEVKNLTDEKDGTVTLYAQWKINRVKVTFKPENGEEAVVREGDYATALTAPECQRTGYLFQGWDPAFTGAFPAADTTYTAKWTPIAYRIAFDHNGGEGSMDTLDMTYDVPAVLTKHVFTRTGYTFTGWKDAEGTSYADQAEVSSLSSENGKTITLSAQWQVNRYRITFDSSGGSDVAAIEQDYDTAIAAPEYPTRDGYTFAGWSPALPAKMPAENLELKALWSANEGAIIFDTCGGSEIESITGHYGDPVTAPADPKREGYTFAGWDQEIPETLNEGVLTIKAQWKANRYTIRFDTDGGSEIAPITQEYGSAIAAPDAPTKTGYTFIGWDNLPDTMPVDGQIVKALWSVNQYTITFDTDGGSNVAPITQDYNSGVTEPNAPTRTGYTFVGWDREIPGTMPAENMTITAKWKVNQYTITFDTDGGSKIAAITQDYGSAVTAPKAPTKDGYTFAGWDREIPGTMPAENLTIRALWEKVPAPSSSFTDIAPGAYYEKAVAWAVNDGITNGTSDTTFSPDAPCNRGQIVTFLWRMAGKPKAQERNNPFADVKEGTFCYEAVLWAAEQGITTGKTATTFCPTETCNRGQIVTFLWRYAGKPAPQNQTKRFNDVAAGSFCDQAVLWAVENRITFGKTATTFDPTGKCTRAQAVTFLYRGRELLKDRVFD